MPKMGKVNDVRAKKGDSNIKYPNGYKIEYYLKDIINMYL